MLIDTLGFGVVSPIQSRTLEAFILSRERVSNVVVVFWIFPLHIHSYYLSVRRSKRDTYMFPIDLSSDLGVLVRMVRILLTLQFLGVAMKLGAELSCVSSFSAILEDGVPTISPIPQF